MGLFEVGYCWSSIQFLHKVAILVHIESELIVCKSPYSDWIFVLVFDSQLKFSIQFSFVHGSLIKAFRYFTEHDVLKVKSVIKILLKLTLLLHLRLQPLNPLPLPI